MSGAYELKQFATSKPTGPKDTRPHQGSGGHCYFLDLPNELLFRILSQPNLSLSSVFDLSLSCRRLRQIGFTVYLDRSGIPAPEQECKIVLPDPLLPTETAYNSPHDPLQALRLEPAFVKTQSLVCVFPLNPKQIVGGQLRHISRLEKLIRNLMSVQSVVLEFNPEQCLCPHNSNVTPATQSDELLQKWSEGIGSLLNAIIERGCESLRVKGLRYLCSMYGFRVYPQTQVSAAFRTVSYTVQKSVAAIDGNSVLHGPSWAFHRLPIPSKGKATHLAQLSETARKATALKHLTISSTTLLLPPILQWVQDVLKASPIECITFSDFKFNNLAWRIIGSIFSRAAPNVKKLEFHNVGLFTPAELLSVVSMFPKLTSLSLQGLKAPPPTTGTTAGALNRVDPKAATPTYVTLTHLRAHGRWIHDHTPLLQRDIPSLQSVTVIWSRTSNFPDSDTTEESLDVARQVLNTFTTRNAEKQRAVPLKVSFEIIGSFLAPTTVANDLTTLPDEASCVSTLIISDDSVNQEVHPRQAQHTIRFYLKNFPRIERLVMDISLKYAKDGVALETYLTQAIESTDHATLSSYVYNGVEEKLNPTNVSPSQPVA